MEERKQEMPDVHQPDLFIAGEQEWRLGYPHWCHMIRPPRLVQSQMLSLDFPKKNMIFFLFSAIKAKQYEIKPKTLRVQALVEMLQI